MPEPGIETEGAENEDNCNKTEDADDDRAERRGHRDLSYRPGHEPNERDEED